MLFRSLKLLFDRMSQRVVQVPLVAIPAPVAQAPEVISLLEAGHDPLDGPLYEPQPICHFSEAHLGLFCDPESHVGVVTQECPPGTVCHDANTMRHLLTSVDREAINLGLGCRMLIV